MSVSSHYPFFRDCWHLPATQNSLQDLASLVNAKSCQQDVKYCPAKHLAVGHSPDVQPFVLCYNSHMAIKHLEKLRTNTYFKGSGLPCVVREMRHAPSNTYIAMHDHEFSELVLVASGRLKHIHSEETVQLRQGDFFVIHPGERHGYAELTSGTVVFNVLYHAMNPPLELIAASPLASILFPSGLTTRSAEVLGCVPKREIQRLLGLVKAIRREEEGERPFRSEICASLFVTFLLELSRWTNVHAPCAPNNILKAVDFISANLGGHISLNDLCAVSGQSASTLHRAFRKAFGRSPIDYVISLRLAKAKALLANGKLSLEKVAAQTGFCSASHLSYMLRRGKRGAFDTVH